MNRLQDILPQIGYGFVCSFWQMALLLAVYKLAAAVYLPAAAARFRFAVLLTLAGSLWFVYSIGFSHPAEQWNGLKEIMQAQPISQTLPQLLKQTLYWLGWAYLAMLIFSLLKGRLEWKAALRMKAEVHGKAPVDWRLFVEKYAALLDIKKKISLKISGAFSPVTFGFFKPVILLPASCLTGLEPVQLEAILLHELAHIRRNDYLYAWVLQFCEMLLYFNPFMRQLVKEARMECENACDDLVMQFEYHPVSYAQALLSVAKNGEQMRWALHAQGSGKQLLFNRIARLVGQPVQKDQYSLKASLKVLALPLAAILLILAAYPGWDGGGQKEVDAAITPVINLRNMAVLPEKSRKESLLEARTALLAEATNRALIANEKLKEQTEQERIFQQGLEKQAEMAAILPHPEPSPALVLSANWAEDQQTGTEVRENLQAGWERFAQFLEKLETNGDLEEKEWQQLATLISLYADIRNTIFEETARSQNPAEYAAATSAEPMHKVLVLIHDENTGLLYASLMDPAEINNEYSGEPITANTQPVILLRKKASGNKKVISL